MRDVQAALKDWHRKRFPRTTLDDLGLKLAEEAGEVVGAIVRLNEIARRQREGSDLEWRERLTDEIGDVAIVLLVLCARGGLDFEEVVADRAAEVMLR